MSPSASGGLLLNKLNDWATTVNLFAPCVLFLASLLIAARVTPLIRHHRMGMGASTQKVRGPVSSNTPSVASAVGSGARPITSAWVQFLPRARPRTG